MSMTSITFQENFMEVNNPGFTHAYRALIMSVEALIYVKLRMRNDLEEKCKMVHPKEIHLLEEIEKILE